MFVNLRRVPDYAGKYSSGIIVAIDPGLPFYNIDGCLQFLRLCLKEIPPRYGKQRDVWTRCLLRISDLAASLRDSRTRFTGKQRICLFPTVSGSQSSVKSRQVTPSRRLCFLPCPQTKWKPSWRAAGSEKIPLASFTAIRRHWRPILQGRSSDSSPTCGFQSPAGTWRFLISCAPTATTNTFTTR